MKLLLDFPPIILFFAAFKYAQGNKEWAAALATSHLGFLVSGNMVGVNEAPVLLATVVVTAQLPPFAQPGQMIDVTVSSIGSAKSIKGGTLIATPLRGADGEIYAIAQGNLVVAGAGATGGRANTAGDRSSVQVNHLIAGRIPDGALVERSVPTPLHEGDTITLGLNASDFQTARTVAQAINARRAPGTADALDPRTVRVQALPDAHARVNFIADLEALPLPETPRAAKVVIHARTGSIVLNQAVTLGPCAIAHGNLSVIIDETPVISQPGAFSQGQTVVAQKSDIQIRQEPGNIIQVPASAQLADVVRAQQLPLINGGYAYDATILKRLNEVLGREVFKLFQAEDVGFAFKPLFPEEERAFADLLSGLNRRLAAHQLEVVLNYFSPHDIPMLYISSQQTQAERELERVAEASNDLFGGILGSLQEEEQAPLAQLYLNFHNEVVQSVFCSGKSETTIASVVEVLYVQALLMGHYPLKQNEVKLMNQGLLSIIKAMK